MGERGGKSFSRPGATGLAARAVVGFGLKRCGRRQRVVHFGVPVSSERRNTATSRGLHTASIVVASFTGVTSPQLPSYKTYRTKNLQSSKPWLCDRAHEAVLDDRARGLPTCWQWWCECVSTGKQVCGLLRMQR